MKKYRDRLAYLMEIRGFGGKGGQSALARLIGCKAQAIQYLLSPSNNPRGSKYTLAISRALSCDPHWLESGVGDAPTPLAASNKLIAAEPSPVYKANTDADINATGNGAHVWPFSVPLERVLALPPRLIGKIDGYIEREVEEYERCDQERGMQKAA